MKTKNRTRQHKVESTAAMARPTGNGGGKCPGKCSKCTSLSAENRRLKREMDNLKKIIDYQQGERTRARVAELNKLREQEVKAPRLFAQNRERNHSESEARDMEKVFDSINKKFDDYVERAKKTDKVLPRRRRRRRRRRRLGNGLLMGMGALAKRRESGWLMGMGALMIKRFFWVHM